jgi:hypothetical protein
MRAARKIYRGGDAYYHCCSRMAGPVGVHPFTDADKGMGMALVVDAARLSMIEPLSVCWMGNHWHLVCSVPGEAPDARTAAGRWNAYHGLRRERLDAELDPGRCAEVGRDLVNLSRFMAQVNQLFAVRYNHAHERRGTLWSERFRSVCLRGRRALWACVKYVELNPVRAGLHEDPGEYAFSSFGRHCREGRHPFADNFVRHLRRSLGNDARGMTAEEVFAEFAGELARTIAAERGEDPLAAMAMARSRKVPRIRYLRRTRLFSDAGILDDRVFVREAAQAARKGKGGSPGGRHRA